MSRFNHFIEELREHSVPAKVGIREWLQYGTQLRNVLPKSCNTLALTILSARRFTAFPSRNASHPRCHRHGIGQR